LTENFIARAKEAEPTALICEGTRMAAKETRQNYSEPQVKATDKAVFTMHASRDIDRFKSFYEVAKKNGRKMAITPKTAYLLTKLLDDEHLPVPDPLKDDCLGFITKRRSLAHTTKKITSCGSASSSTRW
jgi:mRNA degradation ribonuclease J1/J2